MRDVWVSEWYRASPETVIVNEEGETGYSPRHGGCQSFIPLEGGVRAGFSLSDGRRAR